MSVIPKIPRASGGALLPWAPYQGSTLDQLGTLSGPQIPRLLTPPNHKSWIRPWYIVLSIDTIAGADPGGGDAPGAAPPKIGEKYDILV